MTSGYSSGTFFSSNLHIALYSLRLSLSLESSVFLSSSQGKCEFHLIFPHFFYLFILFLVRQHVTFKLFFFLYFGIFLFIRLYVPFLAFFFAFDFYQRAVFLGRKNLDTIIVELLVGNLWSLVED